MFWPDTHYPNHDPVAVEIGKRVIEEVMPDLTVFGGDVLECEAFGSHPKSRVLEGERAQYIEGEVEPARKLLDFAERHSDHVAYLEGNHEYRVERHCANARGADAYFEAVDPKRLLSEGRSKSRFTWVPYLDVAGSSYNTLEICGELELSTRLVATHGWSHAKRAAEEHLKVSRSASVIYHHTHRAEKFVTRDPWDNKLLISMSAGCMCKLSAGYTGSKPTGWSHGLVLAYIGRRSYSLYQIPIVGNECVLPGGERVSI